MGLTLYGVSMGMMVRSGLGLDPWDVFHYGIAQHLPVSFGTVTIIVGVAVLLLWIPLRQWPGLGTVANVVVIGLATDATLALLEAPDAMALRVVLLVGGIVLNGLAGALYIGSQFGPGPRDGLMTGLVRRTGRSFRLVRTSIEVTVLVVGWLLGGVVGLGTVLYAVLIGPVVQVFLPIFTVPLDGSGRAWPARRLQPEPLWGQASRASTKGSTPGAPARRRAAAATVRVQRELATSSTSRTGPSSPRRPDACSATDLETPPHAGQPEGAVAARLADRPAVDGVERAQPLHPAHLGDAPAQRLDQQRAGAGRAPSPRRPGARAQPQSRRIGTQARNSSGGTAASGARSSDAQLLPPARGR